MSVLKSVLYAVGALAIGTAGICVGWELREKFGEDSISSINSNDSDDDDPRRPTGTPTRPSSGSGEPDAGVSDDDLGDFGYIRDEITKIIEKTTHQGAESEAFK